MTAPPEFGAAIPTNGVRLPWLPDDVLIQHQECDDPHWFGKPRGIRVDRLYWPCITAIRLERPRYDFVYLALERGMVPWFGGDEAPGDWDGKCVLFRDGRVVYNEMGRVWKLGWDYSYGGGDVIGYTRKATSTALPLAHPAAPQGEEGYVLVPRVPTEAMLSEGCDTLNNEVSWRGKEAESAYPCHLRPVWDAMLAALAPAAIASGREGAE